MRVNGELAGSQRKISEDITFRVENSLYDYIARVGNLEDMMTELTTLRVAIIDQARGNNYGKLAVHPLHKVTIFRVPGGS